MAEFCLDCAREHFGNDVKSDFHGILEKEESENGKILSVLCEGCGYTYVDHEGKKVEDKKFNSIKYLRKLYE